MLRDANGTAAGRPGHPVSCHAMTGGARPLCHPEQDPEPSADRGRGAEHEGRRERQEEPSARPRRADHRAYGFDFSPIAARYPEIMRLVEEARAARRWSPVPDQDGLVSGGSPCSLVVPSALPSLWHATGSAPALPLRASAGPQALRKTNSGRSMPDRRRHRIRGHRGPGRGSDPHCGAVQTAAARARRASEVGISPAELSARYHLPIGMLRDRGSNSTRRPWRVYA